jgi:hypothetical protein
LGSEPGGAAASVNTGAGLRLNLSVSEPIRRVRKAQPCGIDSLFPKKFEKSRRSHRIV